MSVPLMLQKGVEEDEWCFDVVEKKNGGLCTSRRKGVERLLQARREAAFCKRACVVNERSTYMTLCVGERECFVHIRECWSCILFVLPE